MGGDSTDGDNMLMTSLMQLDKRVFQFDGASFTVSDTLIAARLGGWLNPFSRNVAESLAAEAWLDARGADVSSAELQAALDNWRAERNLLTEEEVEQWFAKMSLDLDSLTAFLQREICRQRADLSDALAQNAPSMERVLSVLPESLVFSGGLNEMIQNFAAHAAVKSAADEDLLHAERTRLLKAAGLEDACELALACEAFDCSVVRGEQILDIEAGFNLLRASLIMPQDLASELNRKLRDFAWCDCAISAFESEGAAREAISCIRDDGRTLQDVAVDAEVFVRLDRWFHSDVNACPLGVRLDSACEGEAIGPINFNGKFVVGHVLAKGEGDLADPQLRRRVEESILRRVTNPALARVTFLLPLFP